MKSYYRGNWTFLLISENHHLQWILRVYAPYWLKHMYSVLYVFTRGPILPNTCAKLCSRDSAWVGVICEKRCVICVFCVHYSFCGVSSASCLSSVMTFFIISIDVRSTFSWQIINSYSANVSSCRTSANNMCGSQRTLTFTLSIKHHYRRDSFFEETIR